MFRQHCVAVLLCCLSADGLLRPPSPPPARRAVRLQSTTLDPETVAALGLSDASCDVDDDAPSALPAAVATARDSGSGGGGGLLEVQLWPTLVKAMDHTLLTRGQEGELCAQSRLFQEMQKTRATLTNVLGRAPTDSEWCAACGHAGPPARFRADRCRALAARQAMASNNLKLVLSVATGLRRHELRKPLGRRLDQIPYVARAVRCCCCYYYCCCEAHPDTAAAAAATAPSLPLLPRLLLPPTPTHSLPLKGPSTSSWATAWPAC